jgi:hypothetical protein
MLGTLSKKQKLRVEAVNGYVIFYTANENKMYINSICAPNCIATDHYAEK